MIETFLICAGVVALGEIGDKTQLLALMLAARYRKPGAIVLGIIVATLANHALAGLVGNAVQRALPPEVLRWFVAVAFFAVALWALKPDTIEQDPQERASSLGVLGVTIVTFFIAEMGDKTQIATALLAARFSSLLAVVLGTTVGMLIADVPVVFLGSAAATKVPFKAVRIAAATLFAVLGVATLVL